LFKTLGLIFTVAHHPFLHNHLLHHPFPSIIVASKANIASIAPALAVAILLRPFLLRLLLQLRHLPLRIDTAVAVVDAITTTITNGPPWSPTHPYRPSRPFHLPCHPLHRFVFTNPSARHIVIASSAPIVISGFHRIHPAKEVVIAVAVAASCKLVACLVVAVAHFVVAVVASKHFASDCIVVVGVQCLPG
jgi:hypothetical protein